MVAFPSRKIGWDTEFYVDRRAMLGVRAIGVLDDISYIHVRKVR
jgi:hypothetical protein